jgi:very-short-patch-repair endonuclease
MEDMEPPLDTDHRIARLAAAQEGVVRHCDLLDLGLTQAQIRHRRDAGRLIDLHPEVYAVGHDRLSVAGLRLATVWTYGHKAALSHRSAAAAWGLRASGGGRFEVTVATTAGLVERDGTRLHRTGRPLETTRLGLLPITTPARTLLDLAGVVPSHQLEAALKQADVLDLFDLVGLRAAVAAHPRHPGRRPLSTALDAAARTELALTLSDLEELFRVLCARRGLSQPAANARLLRWRVDFFWPDQRLVVETDGWGTHKTRAAFEDDRKRDQALVVAGYRVVRFTYRQVVDTPDDVGAALARLLARGA